MEETSVVYTPRNNLILPFPGSLVLPGKGLEGWANTNVHRAGWLSGNLTSSQPPQADATRHIFVKECEGFQKLIINLRHAVEHFPNMFCILLASFPFLDVSASCFIHFLLSPSPVLFLCSCNHPRTPQLYVQGGGRAIFSPLNTMNCCNGAPKTQLRQLMFL